MQKWWLVGAGVVGVALAVLLLGRPFDTGGEVAPPEGPGSVVIADGEVPQDGVIRGADGGSRSGLTRPGVERMVRDGAGSADIVATGELGAGNPLARRTAARRDSPEARFASRTLAPWTQVRREIMGAAPDDPEAEALVTEVNELLEDLRVLRRDPGAVDFEDLTAAETALVGKIQASRFNNAGVTEMLGLIGQRRTDYGTEKTAEASGGTAEGEPAPDAAPPAE